MINYLRDVPHYEFANLYLNSFAVSDDTESLLPLNSILQPSELPLFRPIVKCRHEDDDDYGNKDGGTFDPRRVFLLFLLIVS